MTNQIRKGTKRYYIAEMEQVFEAFDTVTEEIYKMVEEGKCKSGATLVHTTHSCFSFKWLHGFEEGGRCRMYGTPFEETKLWEFQYHAKRAKEALTQAEDFIEKYNY